MPWERYDKDGHLSAGILIAALGMGGVEAEVGCVGTVVVFKLWDKGETELIFPPLQTIPQFAFPTRSHLVFFFPFTSAPLTARSLSSPFFLLQFLCPSSPVHTPLSSFE